MSCPFMFFLLMVFVNDRCLSVVLGSQQVVNFFFRFLLLGMRQMDLHFIKRQKMFSRFLTRSLIKRI